MILISIYATGFAIALGTILSMLRARLGILLPIGLLVASAAAIFGSIFLPTVLYFHDTYLGDLWTAFEAANKSANGLASSKDYFSPIGPIYDWVFRLAAATGPLDASIVPRASGLFALGVAALACVVLWGRVSATSLALCVFIAVAAAVSPREIELLAAEADASWLAPYNRWAWGMSVITTMALVAPRASMGLAAAMLTGVSLAVLLLLKITYGMALLGLFILAVPLTKLPVRTAAIILASVMLTLGLAQLLTGQILPYLNDLVIVSGIDSNGLRMHKLLSQIGEMSFWILVAWAVLGTVLAFRRAAQDPVDPVLFWQTAALIAVIGVMACAILMQNHYASGSPLYALLVVIAAERAGAFHDLPFDFKRAITPLVLVLALPFSVMDVGHLMGQFAQTARILANPNRGELRTRALILHERYNVQPCSKSACIDWTRMEEGLKALRELGAADESAGAVAALNFSNPFPFGLKRPSPPRIPIWLHVNRSFSANVHIPPEIFFEEVGFVAVAKLEPNSVVLFETYGDYVKMHFDLVADLDHWTIYRLKPSPARSS